MKEELNKKMNLLNQLDYLKARLLRHTFYSKFVSAQSRIKQDLYVMYRLTWTLTIAQFLYIGPKHFFPFPVPSKKNIYSIYFFPSRDMPKLLIQPFWLHFCPFFMFFPFNFNVFLVICLFSYFLHIFLLSLPRGWGGVFQY